VSEVTANQKHDEASSRCNFIIKLEIWCWRRFERGGDKYRI